VAVRAGRTTLGVGAVLVVGVGVLGEPHDQDDPADDRDEADELQPPASPGVVQTASADGEVRDDRGQEQQRLDDLDADDAVDDATCRSWQKARGLL